MNKSAVIACMGTSMASGGVSVVLVKGPEESLSVIDNVVAGVSSRKIAPGKAILGVLTSAGGEKIDHVVLSCPSENRRIISGHGGITMSRAIISCLNGLGIEVAQDCGGDFADFFGGESGSIEAEADALLATCRTEAQAAMLLHSRAALPQKIREIADMANRQDAAGQLKSLIDGYGVADGLLGMRKICLTGAPNVGKSSLMNRILEHERVLVSDIAGTTRDAVVEYADIGGYAAEIADTAGIRVGAGEVEKKAQERAAQMIADSDLAVVMFDVSRELSDDDRMAFRIVREKCGGGFVILLNKTDLPQKLDEDDLADFADESCINRISCGDAEVADVFAEICATSLGGGWNGEAVSFTVRQLVILQEAREMLFSGEEYKDCLMSLV